MGSGGPATVPPRPGDASASAADRRLPVSAESRAGSPQASTFLRALRERRGGVVRVVAYRCAGARLSGLVGDAETLDVERLEVVERLPCVARRTELGRPHPTALAEVVLADRSQAVLSNGDDSDRFGRL